MHYLNGESAGDNGVNPVTEGIKLLVAATDHVVFEDVTRPAVKLKQSHVELHGEIYSIKYRSHIRPTDTPVILITKSLKCTQSTHLWLLIILKSK